MKSPNLPKIDDVIFWSDDIRYNGTIYKSPKLMVNDKSRFNSHVADKIKIVNTIFLKKI